MKFGICCGPGSLPPSVEGEPLSSVARLMEVMESAGADYLEFPVGAVMPKGGEAEWHKLREALSSHDLRIEAFNSFIPAQHRITGPDVDHAKVLEFCREALGRCKEIGGQVVVLGSAGARRVPEGFGQGTAEQQFVDFCRQLGPVADAIDINIAIEPLNSHEDNLILSVEHGARLVDEVAHPRIGLLADFYHMSEENEPVEHAGEFGSRLIHTHLADVGRVAPGFAEGAEADFLGFFTALRRAGYNARCSFEGKSDDIAAQSGPLLDHLRQRWEESAI